MQDKLEEKINALLTKGVDAKDEHGCTALLLACEAGNFEYAKGLLQKGANVNVRSNDGRTPLMVALEKGDVNFAILLINAGANVAVVLNSKYLTREFLKNHPEFVRLMTTGGTSAETLSDVPVMNFAGLATDADALNAFIESGGVPPGSPASYNCMMAAAETGNMTAIDLLISQNPRINMRYQDKRGRTVMMAAAQHKNDDFVLKAQCKFIATIVLQHRMRKGIIKNYDIGQLNQFAAKLETIGEKGKEFSGLLNEEERKLVKEVINIKDNEGKTVTEYCIEKGHIKSTSMLMKMEGAQIDSQKMKNIGDYEKAYREFLQSSPNNDVISTSVKISDRIFEMRTEHNLKPRDKTPQKPTDKIHALRLRKECRKKPPVLPTLSVEEMLKAKRMAEPREQE